MSQDHYMPWFVGDFMAATATWTGPERGLYLQLLGIQWTSGPLPCDLDRLALVLHYDPKEFRKLWPVMAGKFKNGDGALTNTRLETVRAKNTEIQTARSEAGRRGGQASGQARANQIAKQAGSKNEAIASNLVEANAKQTSSKNEPSDPIRSESDPNLPKPRTKRLKATRRAEPPDWYVEFKSLFPRRAGDPDWAGGLRAANQRLAEGHDPKDFIAGARRYGAYVLATKRENTDYIQQASRFLGPGKPFLLPWIPPAEPETAYDEIQRLNGGSNNAPAGRVFDAERPEPRREGLVPLFGIIRR